MINLPDDPAARREFFLRIRARIIRDTFGGVNTYRLLCERNPEIDMLLNSGICAGMTLSQEGDEEIWSVSHAM